MTTVLLVRHGLTRLTGPVLAGWTPGLHLDERGIDQAAKLAERLRAVPLAAVVSSSLDRCLDTAVPIAASHDLEVAVDARLGEVRYGDWTGRELKQLYSRRHQAAAAADRDATSRLVPRVAAVARSRSTCRSPPR